MLRDHHAAPAAEDLPHTLQNAARPLKILIVDDNVDSLNMTATLLDSLGYETCIANDALSAMTMARQNLPVVILLDIGLPGNNG